MKLPWVPFLLCLLLGAPCAAGQTFTEFPVPTPESQSDVIAPGPDGNLWFTEYAVNRIGRITPDGTVTEFPIPVSGAPLGITAGPEGALWFTQAGAQKIGRITTAGVIDKWFSLPHPVSGPASITAGPDGNLWFTEAVGGNSKWRMTPSGIFTEFPLPTPGSADGAITVGPDGNIWFAEWIVGNRIGRITPAGVITEFPIPTQNSRTWAIAAGPDGALWFAEARGNKIGRITTSGAITEFPIPTPGSTPFGIVAGIDGNLYFAESRANKIGRITTSGVITEFPIPTPSYIDSITSGPDGAIWFTEFEAGKIGRMSIGPVSVDRLPPVLLSPRERRTRILPPQNSPTADLYLAPTTPPCTGLMEVTGIYQDGKGTYLPGDMVVWASTTNGVDLRIKPLCSANRQLNARLPAAAIALLTGPMNPCQGSGGLNTIQLKIPDLQDAPTGIVGQPSLPPDYPKADSVYFYFLVDSNHDGSFGPGDDGYNLVWQSGIYLSRTEYSDRTVYDLTTDLTSPNAELIKGIGTGGTSKGTFCVPLRLMVTQLK